MAYASLSHHSDSFDIEERVNFDTTRSALKELIETNVEGIVDLGTALFYSKSIMYTNKAMGSKKIDYKMLHIAEK